MSLREKSLPLKTRKKFTRNPRNPSSPARAESGATRPAARTLLRELFVAAAGVVEIAFEHVLPASQDSLNVHRTSLFFLLAQPSPRLCSSVRGSFLRS